MERKSNESRTEINCSTCKHLIQLATINSPSGSFSVTDYSCMQPPLKTMNVIQRGYNKIDSRPNNGLNCNYWQGK